MTTPQLPGLLEAISDLTLDDLDLLATDREEVTVRLQDLANLAPSEAEALAPTLCEVARYRYDSATDALDEDDGGDICPIHGVAWPYCDSDTHPLPEDD